MGGGPQPIAGWQIVLSLPNDDVISVSNASAFVVNGILLLQPAASAQPIAARGGTLKVFFVAEGLQETPTRARSTESRASSHRARQTWRNRSRGPAGGNISSAPLLSS